MAYPENYRYSKEHEWVLAENGVATVGITDYAQQALGDVVYVELPTVGDEVEKDGEMGSIESVKAASEIYAPVGGEIIEANEALDDDPEIVNKAPHEDGWIAKIKMSNADEVDALMTAGQYQEFLEGLE